MLSFNVLNKVFYFLKQILVFFIYGNYNFLTFIRFFLLFCFIDMLIIDDEPLWEPIEWSLIQSWLFFIFLFSWIAETLITASYGSFTGRDKRVYNGLLKAYWLVELLFMVTLVLIGIFVVTPFYYELTYKVSNIITWWSWYNRYFFIKFLVIWYLIDLLTISCLFLIKWLNWKNIFLLLTLNLFLLFFLFFNQFLVVWFGYFTDILSFKNNHISGFKRLSEGPYKFGWGNKDRDFFTYKKTSSNFWYKNDAMFASILFFINIFYFLSLSFLLIQNILVLKKLYFTKMITYSLLNYFSSSLNLFFVFFMFFFFFIIIVFIFKTLRTPYCFVWCNYLLDLIRFYN